MTLTREREVLPLGSITPKMEGMTIPKKMVELYGFGVGVNYPHDDFVRASREEFGVYPYIVEEITK